MHRYTHTHIDAQIHTHTHRYTYICIHIYTHTHTCTHVHTHIHTMLCKRNNSKRNENSKFKTAMESLLTNQFILVLLFISIKLGIHVVRFSGFSSVEGKWLSQNVLLAQSIFQHKPVNYKLALARD